MNPWFLYLFGVATPFYLATVWRVASWYVDVIVDMDAKIVTWPEDEEPWRRVGFSGRVFAISRSNRRTLAIAFPRWLDRVAVSEIMGATGGLIAVAALAVLAMFPT